MEPSEFTESSKASASRPVVVAVTGTRRWIYIGLGWFCVGLAVAGVVLPVLPSTPFLLLAAFFFARSSPRFYQWLLDNRTFGPIIREWREHRSIPRRAKYKAIALIIITFGITLGFFVKLWFLRVMLLLIGAGVITFLLRLPSRD